MVFQSSQLLFFCLLFGLCSSIHSERWRTSSNTKYIDEKRRLLNLRKEETEILNNKNNEEADETRSESKIERFVRLLQDEDELESVTENEEPVKRTRTRGKYSLNPRKKLMQLLEEIKQEKKEEKMNENNYDFEDSYTLPEENPEASLKEAISRKEEIPGVGELFEGDIVMDPRLYSAVTGESEKRDAVTDEDYLWPDKRVPYVLSDKLSELTRERIHDAMADFRKYTCVKFEPKEDSDKDYVYFFSNKSMCYSTVGRAGGRQKISIGRGCERKGTVVHEMLHSIGFIHEQSRPDRDKYAKVFLENIKKRMLHNFKKYPRHIVSSLGEEYDFDSVMHYHNKAFSKNGEDTIESLENPSRRFGQRVGFSRTDIKQVNKLYPCHKDADQMDDIPYE